MAHPAKPTSLDAYQDIQGEIVLLVESARASAARSVNALMTATYWEIGRRIVINEQGGLGRAGYGAELIPRLAEDLTRRFGRGFGWRNLTQMRNFFLAWPADILQTVSAEWGLPTLARRFPLPWSAYVRLLGVKDPEARAFYEREALHGGWSIRQLDRQIESQFFERAALSRDKAKLLSEGERPLPGDLPTPAEAVRDPFVLEFLGLKDDYSESDLEEALVAHLQDFLLELGDDFAFVGRQRRLRLDDTWFRVDLLFYHRGLKCLVVVDLKVGRFTPGDAGQMHLYLHYAREHWMREGENPPVGLILCAAKGRRRPATPSTTCPARSSPPSTGRCFRTPCAWPGNWSAPAGPSRSAGRAG
ncbi:MAG TPA: PDDEXK nuclease domain-containing protein [Holophaga sp.]|nr:PDDEXK nuclease domain-containing protein [Holophaga sp.]